MTNNAEDAKRQKPIVTISIDPSALAIYFEALFPEMPKGRIDTILKPILNGIEADRQSQRQKLLTEIEEKAPKNVFSDSSEMLDRGWIDDEFMAHNRCNAAWRAVLKEMRDE